jgi:4-diphosphocytidyl-2-C-methyl-D-erythritol kinase
MKFGFCQPEFYSLIFVFCNNPFMICFPNAKINIGLNVVEKRPDGFHNIETVFCPVELCDILEFIEAEEFTFSNSGLPVGNNDQNLVVKAYHLLKEKFSLPPLSVYLHKVIPMGAGLGGGSSDAAFMINNLNKFFSLNLTEDEQEETARKLGSDCAFFIRNKPVFAYEKGDKFKEFDFFLPLYHILIVYPGIHVSTPDAYSAVKPAKPENKLIDLIEQPVHQWKEVIKNDFEISVFKKYPAIKEIKEELYNKGAVYASMSGSGSAVYGLFESVPEQWSDSGKYFSWTGRIKF